MPHATPVNLTLVRVSLWFPVNRANTIAPFIDEEQNLISGFKPSRYEARMTKKGGGFN